MKALTFQKYFGGTAACMKRLQIANKGCGQLKLNYTCSSDSWFSSVKTDEEKMAAGINYCGPAKMSHKGSCLSTLEMLMKY